MDGLDKLFEEINEMDASVDCGGAIAENNFLQVEFDAQSGGVEMDGNKVYIRNIRRVSYGEV